MERLLEKILAIALALAIAAVLTQLYVYRSTLFPRWFPQGRWYNVDFMEGYHPSPQQLLWDSVYWKDISNAKQAIIKGADVNEIIKAGYNFRSKKGLGIFNGDAYPLRLAIDNEDLPMVKLLLGNGANTQVKFSCWDNKSGRLKELSPSQLASSLGFNDIARLLETSDR